MVSWRSDLLKISTPNFPKGIRAETTKEWFCIQNSVNTAGPELCISSILVALLAQYVPNRCKLNWLFIIH